MRVPLIVFIALATGATESRPACAGAEVFGAQPAADAPPGSAAGSPEEPAEAGRFHLDLGADFTNAYVDRGVVIEDDGWVIQPWAEAAYDIVQGEGATVSLVVGTWHSFHSEATDAGTSDSFRETWYEADFYGGVRWAGERWSITPAYNYYISPSDAWEDLAEVSLAVEFDDSGLLGDWTLSPSALLAVETGPRSNDGLENGVYLQLGVEPAYTIETGAIGELTVSLPVALGLSPDEYYEDEADGNDFFGFASVGMALSLPLPAPGGLGEWSLTAGVNAVFLGDINTDLNDGDGTEVVAMVGVTVSF